MRQPRQTSERRRSDIAADKTGEPSSVPADGFDFLVLAKRREIVELQALARTGGTVTAVARLIHALQRERGASNVYLSSGGRRFAGRLAAQSVASQEMQAEVMACFEALLVADAALAASSRLLGRLACVVRELQALDGLRAEIRLRKVAVSAAAARFSQLIAGLLEVVFEAADGSPRPEISRILLALFNFMQGKELAGQERALGSGCFAAGRVGETERDELIRLIDGQDHCFQVFVQFAPASSLAAWQCVQQDPALITLEQLRRFALTRSAGGAWDEDASERWFECCTRRIDLMQEVEAALSGALHTTCRSALSEAEAALADQRRLLADRQAQAGAWPAPRQDVPASASGPEGETLDAASVRYGAQLERSMLDMLVEQGARLQQMGAQLAAVRSALDERKLIERAKGMLMASRGIGEAEAHGRLRQMAMNGNRRIVEVAEALLAVSDCLTPDGKR